MEQQLRELSLDDKREKFIVAAIDFGTTYSGYAFSLKHDFSKDPTQHIVLNTWEAGQLLSYKAPTCVLFNEAGEFVSFGYEAEERYSELALDASDEDDEGDETDTNAEKKELSKWFYFERFKMKLQGQKIHRKMCIKDVRGRDMLAKTVFSACIKFLKDHLMEVLQKRKTTLKLEEIHWVLTVPAIWTDAAKQFMREAGTEAGLPDALLSIALEPEAASLYCQHQHVEQGQQSELVFEPPKAGTKYAVLDLGGGTADFTIHQKQEDGTLKELAQASGGAWGGMYVNISFEDFLISVFGADVFTQFKTDNPAAFIEMKRDFESCKRKLKPKDEGRKITVCAVERLSKIYRKKNKQDIKVGIKDHPQGDKIGFVAGKIRVDFPLFKSFFTLCIDKIVQHIKELMKNPDVSDTKLFLLVGGFSESNIVFDAVKQALPNATVINPPDPGLAVLKGAVIFGHSPVAVSSRIAKYTYGVNISPSFDDKVHPANRKVMIDGVARCKDVFKKYIEKGTPLTPGMSVAGKHVTVREYQAEMMLNIYVSENKNPSFCDEDGYAGHLYVKLPKQKSKIVVEVKLIVGDTELKVEAQEQATNQIFQAYFDFL